MPHGPKEIIHGIDVIDKMLVYNAVNLMLSL